MKSYFKVRGGTVPEAFADSRELNVPELCNGSCMDWISNKAADKNLDCLYCIILILFDFQLEQLFK